MHSYGYTNFPRFPWPGNARSAHPAPPGGGGMVQAARGRPGGADVRGHVSRLQVPGPRTPPRQLWRAALQGEVSDCKYHILALHTVTIDTQEKNLLSFKLLENYENYRKMAQARFFL